ncbi:hypothetical protein C7B81_10070 [Aphanothece cf. minutissima CCALA 015]|uniref:Stomatal closure-related actin-binding protein Ig domain-containing protein n=2 Tax=Aphanothece TaxID=1121 RepID=A0ABX5F6W1_9CHRO|nr:hypothetical protein C7B81_10070 [Aphanothece cf. minutissima CCALA 015]
MAFLRRSSRARVILPLAMVLAALPEAPSLRAQDLVGCQLVDGTLQCVPGVTADPQQQIQLLRQQIAGDQRLEGAVEQRIAGLGQLLLQGEAMQGTLLQATAAAEGLAALPPAAFHWYRLAPGQVQWQLIEGASGPTYALTPADVASQVMVVVAVPTPGGSQRSVSQVVGPVQPRPAN